MKFYRVFFLLIALLSYNLYSAPSSPVPGIDVANQLNTSRDFLTKPRAPLSNDRTIIVPNLTNDLDLGQAKNYKFKLKKVKFTGNTVIATNELEDIFKPYYGKTVLLGEILNLVRKTTNLYRERGYILSQAYLPAQDIDKVSGEITVGIVEGYINTTSVVSESLPYSTKVLLQQYGRRMEKERPLTKDTLERYALLASDISGGNVKVVFTPALNRPGAADLEFVADDMKTVGTDVFYDNRSTRLLGPQEYSGTFYQYNLLYGNSTSFGVNRASTYKELVLYSFSHRQPLNSDGLTLIFSGNKTDTNPDYNALPSELKSAIKTPAHSKQVNLGLEYPIIRSRGHNLIANFKLEGTNNQTDFFNLTLYKEYLRKLRGGVFFDWVDTYFFNIMGTSLIGAEITQGIKTFDFTGGSIKTLNSYIKEEQATRPGTKTGYTKLNGIITRAQPLVYNFNLKLIGLWQYSFDRLLSSEEFGYGGRGVGLGYDSYEISGDHGISGKAELVYNLPSFSNSDDNNFFAKLMPLKTELFGFIDGGRVWNIDAELSDQNKYDDAVSAGLGFRGKLTDLFVFEGYVAKPMTRIVANENNKKPRYFFSVGVAYH